MFMKHTVWHVDADEAATESPAKSLPKCSYPADVRNAAWHCTSQNHAKLLHYPPKRVLWTTSFIALKCAPVQIHNPRKQHRLIACGDIEDL